MLFVNILCLRGYHDHESTSCQVVDKSRSLTRLHSSACTAVRCKPKTSNKTSHPTPQRTNRRTASNRKVTLPFCCIVLCWCLLSSFALPLPAAIALTHMHIYKEMQKISNETEYCWLTLAAAAAAAAGCIFHFTFPNVQLFTLCVVVVATIRCGTHKCHISRQQPTVNDRQCVRVCVCVCVAKEIRRQCGCKLILVL